MKNPKQKNAYRRWRKAIIAGASSGVVTGLILMGSSNTALAETVDSATSVQAQYTAVPGMHMMRQWNSPSKVSGLATSLGLDPTLVQADLKSGKHLKQILQENGIAPAELGKAWSGKKSHNKRVGKMNRGLLH